MDGEETTPLDLKLFDAFPEPVLYMRDGRIQYSNPAMLTLEPAWQADAPLPPALCTEPKAEGVLLCSAGRHQFQGAISPLEGGFLLVLRPLSEPSDPQRSLLPGLLREQAQVILTSLHCLEKDTKEEAAGRTAQNAAMVRQSAAVLLRLTRNLELAERVARSDLLPLNEQTVDVADLCRQTAQGVRDLIWGMNIDLQTDLPAGMVCRSADRQLLETMLLELLSNAVKAVKDGGQVGLRLSVRNSCLVITVWDSGPGLKQQEMAGALQLLPRRDVPRAGAGLQLGLPIASHIARAHGGTLLLENRKEGGLTVTVSLPKKHTGAVLLRSPQCCGEAEERSRLLTTLSDVLPWRVFLL